MSGAAALIKQNVKVSASRLYNIGFPLLILVPLLIDLILIFTIPTESTIKAISPMPSLQKLARTARDVGEVKSLFGLQAPSNSGQLKSPLKTAPS
jgi:hypothetical protein